MSVIARRSRILGVLVACVCTVACGEAVSPSLLIVSLDTLRADHLPTYGYPRDTAPKLDQLAQTGVVFERAFAQETNTTPSHASLFSGLYPHVHGSTRNGVPIGPGVVTLAEILAGAGFATGAVVAATPLKAEASGLDRGFQRFDDAFPKRRRGGREVVARAIDWLRAHPRERFFLFVHFYDAHGAYRPPATYADLFESEARPGRIARIPRYQQLEPTAGAVDLAPFIDRYDDMIRFVDDRLDELLAEVDLDHTVVVVLADHGESLDERFHALDHGGQLFDEQIHIPLVVHAPGIDPTRVTEVARTIDLLPTLLTLLDVPPPAGLELDGRDLVPAMRGEQGAPAEPVFATARAVSRRHADRGYDLDPTRRIEAVRHDGWKLIRYPGRLGDPIELYDLEADPGERANRAGLDPARVASLRAQLDRFSPIDDPAKPAPEPSPRILRELEALGYAE